MSKLTNWQDGHYILKRVALSAILFILFAVLALPLATIADSLLKNETIVIPQDLFAIERLNSPKIRSFYFIFIILAIVGISYLNLLGSSVHGRSRQVKITPDIVIPAPDGKGQYGTARWATSSEIKNLFFPIDKNAIVRAGSNGSIAKAGIYLGTNKSGTKAYCVDDDTHAVILGATGSGKTRNLVLQTISLLAMAGESMIISDVKSELYMYTYPFLESRGYEVVGLDFIKFNKSRQLNLLQPVIDAINCDDVVLASTRTNDLVATLVADGRTSESIWTDGERSIMACAIMAVTYDNRNNPDCQNLTNVYHFIANMCKASGMSGTVPLEEYIRSLKDGHPAKSMVDISEIAPNKMRQSFYASALTSLRLFTDINLANMSCLTDFDIYTTGKKKTAIFLILPDYKSTFYSIATLFVSQQYQIIREQALSTGGRTERRVNFVLEEFGNFAKIADFTKHITIGRGCGIRYFLFLQDFNMLRKVYGEDDAKIIRSNCDTWVYLKSNDPQTNKEFSDKLGKYTIKSPSFSSSTTGGSSSFNFTGRDLLMPEELSKLQRPYQIVCYNGKNSIMKSPDISKTPFNKILGLGSKKHNIQVFIERDNARPERKITAELKLWKPWCKDNKLAVEIFKKINLRAGEN